MLTVVSRCWRTHFSRKTVTANPHEQGDRESTSGTTAGCGWPSESWRLSIFGRNPEARRSDPQCLVSACMSKSLFDNGWSSRDPRRSTGFRYCGRAAVQSRILIRALRIDQAGNSTFPEFLTSSWRAGVVRYDVDFTARSVAYYGCNGEEYIEEYPAIDVK
jgi:hypothetical protein